MPTVWRSIELQRSSKLGVVHAREIKPGIDVSCPAKEELLEGHERAGTQRIDDAAEGDLYKKPLGAGNGYEREVVWEYSCPIRNEMILREGHVGVAAGHHLGKIAVHNADATWEVRRLRGEELVGCRLSDQIVDCSPVPGASFRLPARVRQRDPPPAARDIDEAMNSEWIALANKQREAAVP